jgi:hypothetical protein
MCVHTDCPFSFLTFPEMDEISYPQCTRKMGLVSSSERVIQGVIAGSAYERIGPAAQKSGLCYWLVRQVPLS